MLDSFSLLPFGYAFGAGMLAAVSPCGIALLPAYVSLYLGAQEEDFQGQPPGRRLLRAFLLSLMVTAGFLLFFAAVGSVLSLGGELLLRAFPWFSVLIGVALVGLGAWFLLGGKLYLAAFSRLASRVPGGGRVGGLGFLFFGMAYAFTTLGCALPVFLVVVGSALAEGFARGLLQFIGYALGMSVVLVLVTLGTALAKGALYRWLYRLVPLVSRISGALLVLAGGYLIYYYLRSGTIL